MVKIFFRGIRGKSGQENMFVPVLLLTQIKVHIL